MEEAHLHRIVTEYFKQATLSIYSDAIDRESPINQLIHKVNIILNPFRFNMLPDQYLFADGILEY